MLDVDDLDLTKLQVKRRTNVTHRHPQAPVVRYRHISPVRQRLEIKRASFCSSLYDMEELERLQVKSLFLCVQLCNYDNVVLKISHRTTAAQVITRLRRYREVKKLYKREEALELLPSVCLTLDVQCPALPCYFEIHRLHRMGFWTNPGHYSHSPLLTLRVKDVTKRTETAFKLPEVLQSSKDPLVHGGKAPNWSTNSGEAVAFRLKHPSISASQSEESQGFARYPEFVDKTPDPAIVPGSLHPVQILLPPLQSCQKVSPCTTLREVLKQAAADMKGIRGEDYILRLEGMCEYVWTLDLPLMDIDGIRDSFRSHQIPRLILVPRPSYLQSTGCLPSYALYDLVVPFTRGLVRDILDNLDVKCFPENDLDLDDEETLGRAIRSRTTKVQSDLPDYVAKRSQVFKRGSIFISPPSRTIATSAPARTYFVSPDLPSAPSPPNLTNLIDVRKVHKAFKVKILGIDRLKMYTYDKESRTPLLRLSPDKIRLEVRLFAGSIHLESVSHSTTIAGSSKDASGEFLTSIRWGEWLHFSVKYSQLPLASSLKFQVFAYVAKKANECPKEKLLGWVNLRLFDYANRLETGVRCIGLFPYYSAQDMTGSTTQNSDPEASQLFIQLESFLKPVVFGATSDSVFNVDAYMHDLTAPVPDSDRREILRLCSEHPLYDLSAMEKALLWRYRAFTASVPNGLPKLLQSLDWCDPQCVRDIHYILQFCRVQEPLVGLELLDGKFADVKVRDYAVKCLESMSTYECNQYLIQLVQALKFEPYHDSALARFLMKRALRSPSTIGHTMFWLLRSEMEEPYFQERCGLLLEQFVRRNGAVRNALVFEDHLLRNLENIALTIQKSKKETREELTAELRESLDVLNDEMPEFYPLALNPKVQVRRIKSEECKFMVSKKKPIYLVFENLEEGDEDIHILFKYGDDLRQDMLVLQTMRIMNCFWTAQGLDLRLSLYRCLTLGSGEGMLEIVRGAKTLCDIHKWAGGQRAVFSKKTLTQWFEANQQEHTQQVDNFIRSCAGYSVGMFVLGVGDRHSDNIMLKYSGEIFHIDFGHFLGHFKKKHGVKRETAPFVFTSDFSYAMGGKKSDGYNAFKSLAMAAYTVLQVHRRLFITLFCLMLCSGIPELTRKDIGFLLNTLPPGVAEADAGKVFLKALEAALKSTMTRIMWSIHILAT